VLRPYRRAIDHHRRDLLEELAQERCGLFRQLRLVERATHQLHPAIASDRVDRERQVAHAEPRVSSLLDVSLGSTESPDEKVSQTLLSAREIVGRIHLAENIVCRNLPIERGNETIEPFFADRSVDVDIFHV
jgi:hypothetical protein